MSDLQEPNPNISALASLYPEGKYPSHIDVFGKGGFVALNDEIGLSGYDEFINERIRFLRRKSGMLVYISSDETYHRCLTAGSDETDGQWKREYFTGRYFHGPSAPTADDLQMGERWFDTVVGTEYTYIPIAEGSTYLEWVDMDHLGTGRKYFYGLTAPEAGTDGDPLNIGDKWFNSTVGSEFTYLPTDGTLTGNKQWIDIDSPGSKGEEVLDIWVNESGDTMTGTLTGPHLNFDTGFIGTLTGEKASFRNTQDGRASLEVAIGNTGYTDNFWDFVAGTIVNEEGLTSNVFGVSTTSHSEIPSAGAFNGNLRVGQPTYNEKARLEVFGSISTTGNNNSSVLSTFRSPTLFRGSTGQDSNWEGRANNLTSGSGYDEDLNVSLRALNDVVLGRAHRNSNTPITFPREFITKQYGEDNFGSGTYQVITDDTEDLDFTNPKPRVLRTIRTFKSRNPVTGNLITYQLDNTFLDFCFSNWPGGGAGVPDIYLWNTDSSSPIGRYGSSSSPKVISIQNKTQIPNFGYVRTYGRSSTLFGVNRLAGAGGFWDQAEFYANGHTDIIVPDDEVWYYLFNPIYSMPPNSNQGGGGPEPITYYSLRGLRVNIEIMTYSDPQ